VNRFIDHLQAVTANNFNTIADFHTTNHSTLSSQSAFTGRYLVTALNNGYSSTMFSLDVSCYRILTTEILQLPWSRRCPLVSTPQLNYQLNCSANCLQDNFSARITQKTQPFYCCRGMFTALLHSNCRGADHIENTVLLLLHALTSNSLCLQSHCLATSIYATI
jgi:hypothetical protein